MLRALKLYDNAPPAQFFYQAFHAIEQWQIEEKDEQTEKEYPRRVGEYVPTSLLLCKRGSPYSITECRVPELIPVHGS